MADINMTGTSNLPRESSELPAGQTGETSETEGAFEALRTSFEDAPDSPQTAFRVGSRSSTPDTVIHLGEDKLPSRLETLPPELRENVLRKTMEASEAPEQQASAFKTANNLIQASPTYLQDLNRNTSQGEPNALKQQFADLRKDTENTRFHQARQSVGGPGEEKAANAVLAAAGPLTPQHTADVRFEGARKDITDGHVDGRNAAQIARNAAGRHTIEAADDLQLLRMLAQSTPRAR